MVAAPAAADAVVRARRLPRLRVGLHLVLVDGVPALPPAQVPDLIGADGRFSDDMAAAGLRVFLSPRARRQLAAEIEAQFRAFATSGLTLDHVNAHKHFHLHPAVAGLIIAIGRRYGLGAVRVPAEPIDVLRRVEPVAGGPGAALLRPWLALLRGRLRRAGLVINDSAFGIAWSGAMTEARMLGVLANLPPGISEIYCHPATADAVATPGYRHAEELAALVSPAVRGLVATMGLRPVGFTDPVEGSSVGHRPDALTGSA
jgi:hopanoid biosynthesis associated protein HpnK